MQARSALFDLYGDYLRSRGGRAPVAALVRLLAPLEIAAPAVRTAVSRMVRQGWLVPVRLAGRAGLPAHRTGSAPARRGGRPHLPHRSAGLGRPVRPAGALHHPTAGRPVAGRPTPWPTSGTGGSARRPGWPRERPTRSTRCWPRPGSATSGSAPDPRRRDVRARPPWSGGPGTWIAWPARTRSSPPSSARPWRAPGPDTDEGAYAIRFRLRARLAHVPVPRSATAHGPAARRGGRVPSRPTCSTVHEARLRPAADRFVDSCLA